MKVVLLAAGYATRLYPLTKDKPKAFLPIAGRPMVEYLVDKLANIKDMSELVVVTNEKFDQSFKEWADNFKTEFKITVLNDRTTSNENRLGAIGDLQFAVKNAAINEDILVLASDNLFEDSFSAFFETAQSKSAPVLIGVYDIKDPKIAAGRYGIIDFDETNRVKSIDEKPSQPKTTFVSMGVYYFSKDTLKFIDEYMGSNQSEDAPGHYATWLLSKTSVYAHQFTGKWYDIGSLDQLEEASREFQN